MAWGDFSAAEIRRFVRIQAMVFWGLILLAWLTYHGEPPFSLFTHTFSFLGSFNEEHQPRWWWIFSLAMLFWGGTGAIIALHLHRCFARISKWGAVLGTSGLLLGCAGLVLVGLFPDARAEWYWDLRYTKIHSVAALMVATGNGAGLGCYTLLLLLPLVRAQRGRDRRGRPKPGAAGFPLERAKWPLGFWAVSGGTCMFNVLWWDHLYAVRKAAAVAAGKSIGSAWSEGLNTWHAFPLWENLAIYSLYIALAWLAVAVTVSPESNEKLEEVARQLRQDRGCSQTGQRRR